MVHIFLCVITFFNFFYVIRYDGDNYVRNVDANFIVWDRFGRKDYSFNATMRQVQFILLYQISELGVCVCGGWV